MPKKRIHKDRFTDTRPKTRNRVECNCTLHYNGSKWVDPRTFERHQQEIECFRTIGVSAGKRDQIEIFFKKKFLSKIDVDLIIWSRTFIISKKNFLSIWSLFPALTPNLQIQIGSNFFQNSISK